MCGIAGFISFNKPIEHSPNYLENALKRLSERGPDNKGVYKNKFCELGHSRLSILDTSNDANQPMKDASGRYVLVYNGEIYNFLELRNELIKKGISFSTKSDTEVLLYGLIHYGKEFIQQINGFFSFCFYDIKQNKYLLARDRFGIKPMIYHLNDNNLIFGSELKAILCYPIEKEIDRQSLNLYFRYTYVPAPNTILKNCKKLLPGHCIEINKNEYNIHSYYQYYPLNSCEDDYKTAQQKVKDLFHESVKNRLVSDVPLGTFLSGGVDSSIVSAVAAQYKKDLNTFSIGFPDEPLFDESSHAEKVAKHIGSKHHCFNVTNKQLFQNLDSILDYIDEPMADSSAINVFLLTQQTKQHVTVSLSGDGADELFSGYNKHQALYFSLQNNLPNKLIKKFGGLSHLLPSTRNSKIGNFGRQIQKLHKGLNLTIEDRYLEWASFMDSENTGNLTGSIKFNHPITSNPNSIDSFNDFLYYDFNLVLDNDMLRKVDLMSMANSLEVRTPYLDHELVEYVFSLPSEYKINSKSRKKILKDTFINDLPNEIFKRKKHGFEVPLKKWFQNDLKIFLESEIFSNNILIKEGILLNSGIEQIRQKWNKNAPENTVYHIWSLILLNQFFKKHMI